MLRAYGGPFLGDYSIFLPQDSGDRVAAPSIDRRLTGATPSALFPEPLLRAPTAAALLSFPSKFGLPQAFDRTSRGRTQRNLSRTRAGQAWIGIAPDSWSSAGNVRRPRSARGICVAN